MDKATFSILSFLSLISRKVIKSWKIVKYRNLFLIFVGVLGIDFLDIFKISAQSFALDVPRYGVFEKSFTHSGSYTKPYTAVTATATFTAPNGTTTKTIPLFWDGGATWKVRFSPNSIGTWTWTISSNDAGLNGKSGSFSAVASTKKGGIRDNSADPYHFEYENSTPFWWFGDTQWRACGSDASENLNRSAVLHYIDVRSAQGFNYIHSNLMGPGTNEGGDIFASVSAETLNPAFFQEADYRLQYMNSKGITAGIFLAWSRNPTAGKPSWSAFTSDTARLRYARYVTARYSAYNVVFIVSGEWDNAGLATKPRYKAIGNEIMNKDPHDRMIGIHPGAINFVEEFNTESWMSFGDYQQNYTSLHSAILNARDHNKPVVNAEYAYYLRDQNGDGVVDKPNSATREAFRNASYDIVMAGGYFVTGFGTTYFGGIRDPGPFDVDASKNDVAENDLMNIRNLFTSTIWWLLQPSDSLVTGPGTHYALAEIGEQYLAYVRGSSEAISLSLGGAASKTYEVMLFDPRTGSWTALPDYSGTGPVSLTPPNTQDWVFYLKKKVSSSPQADLSVTKSDSPDPVTVGNNLTYTVSATNNGPSNATGVTLTDTLPAGSRLHPPRGIVVGQALSTATLVL